MLARRCPRPLGIRSFRKYLYCACYDPDIVGGIEDTLVRKREMLSILKLLYFML